MAERGDEKRRFARVPFYGTADLRVQDQWHAITLLDLSLKGAQIQLPDHNNLASGQAVVLRLSLDDRPIELLVDAQVQRLQDGTVGLRFQPLPAATMNHLHRLLELNLGSGKLFES